jgi:YHS domain-containing protein
MSKSILALLCAILLGVGVMGGYASRAADPAPATQPAVDPKPVNSKCLVTGEDIDPAMTVVYDGKTYGFCCQDCIKAFNKNPEKYLSNAK